MINRVFHGSKYYVENNIVKVISNFGDEISYIILSDKMCEEHKMQKCDFKLIAEYLNKGDKR